MPPSRGVRESALPLLFVMIGAMGTYTVHVIALLAGGLGASLGATFWARSPRGSRVLASMGGATFTAALAGAVFLALAAAYGLVRSMATGLDAGVDVTPLALLLLGCAIGVPMGAPGLLVGRSEARRREQEAGKWRERVPTRDDRRAYADQLVAQITELSPTPRRLTASIAGDGGTILRFEGDVTAEEGEKLTRALRNDLKNVGFKRVEGAQGTGEWWSRV